MGNNFNGGDSDDVGDNYHFSRICWTPLVCNSLEYDSPVEDYFILEVGSSVIKPRLNHFDMYMP
jgi:hypothetical protein